MTGTVSTTCRLTLAVRKRRLYQCAGFCGSGGRFRLDHARCLAVGVEIGPRCWPTSADITRMESKRQASQAAADRPNIAYQELLPGMWRKTARVVFHDRALTVTAQVHD